MSDLEIVSAGRLSTGALVRVEGQLETFATTVTEFENVSARDGLAFSWTIVPATMANGDTVLSVQNTHDELILHIIEFRVKTDTSSALVIYTVDKPSTPTAGTLVTGVAWNRRNQNVAEALSFADDQTAHSQETILYNEEIIADVREVVDFQGAVLLGKDQMIAADLAAASTLSSARVLGFYAKNDILRN